jgi:hypothetical protein
LTGLKLVGANVGEAISATFRLGSAVALHFAMCG